MRDINIYNTDMFPYLEGEEIKDHPVTLTIENIRCDAMKTHKGKDENKEVLYFKETKKGFVLNKTNAKRVAQMYGPQTGQWAGKQITITTEPVQAFGELHNALRVALGAGPVSPSNGDMSLEKLLINLNKIERVKGFFENSLEILDSRRGGADLPEPDDMDGWRVLFVDARDYALSAIDQAIEADDVAQPPLLEDDEVAEDEYDTGYDGPV